MDGSIDGWMDGWMDGFYVLFNDMLVITGRWLVDNESLCAMKPRLRLKKNPPQAGLQPRTTRSVGQRLTC